MAPVLGNTAFLHTRAFFSPALESHGWDTEIPTPADVVSSARHLDTVLRPRPARAISGAAREPTHVLASDASAVGIGVVFRGGGSAARSFTAGEAAESSTHREAGGISFAVRVRAAEHAGGKLVAYCDNKGARSVIMYGSHDPRLQRIATGLAAFCHRHDIELIVVWAPRATGCIDAADGVSRTPQEDIHDWALTQHAARRLFAQANVQPDLDAFADANNTKCPRFVSWQADVGCSAVDATSAPLSLLSRTAIYACPPPPLLTAFIARLPFARPTILVVPRWENTAWFCMLFSGNWRPHTGVVLLDVLDMTTATTLGPIGRPAYALSPRSRLVAVLITTSTAVQSAPTD